jgi:hypothetical protein
MEHLRYLGQEYERRGVVVMSPPPSALLAKLPAEYPTLVREAVEQIVKETTDKIEAVSTPTAKANA